MVACAAAVAVETEVAVVVDAVCILRCWTDLCSDANMN